MKKSFVKTYCDIGRKFYGLEVRKEGFSWKVTDVLPLSEREALLASTDPEVNVRGLETADNLLACKGCGSRKVGGCSCAYGGQRCSGDYDLMCVYCKHMKIDRSVPTSSEVRGAGGTIRLSQGQEVKIRFSDDRPLTRIKVGVGWDPAHSGHSVDVDSSVVVGNSQSRDHDLVYFGDLTHPSGCVVHHGDASFGRHAFAERYGSVAAVQSPSRPFEVSYAVKRDLFAAERRYPRHPSEFRIVDESRFFGDDSYGSAPAFDVEFRSVPVPVPYFLRGFVAKLASFDSDKTRRQHADTRISVDDSELFVRLRIGFDIESLHNLLLFFSIAKAFVTVNSRAEKTRYSLIPRI